LPADGNVAPETLIRPDNAPILNAPPKHDGPLPVGGRIQRPARVFYVEPIYPVIAQTARVEGTVILEATIDERGNVADVKVLRSVTLLDRAAIDAVSRWRYSPTTLNGVAVAVVMTVTVTFTMR
jgi:protein TonB